MMKTVTNVLGALLCLTAVIGFFDHDFMGMVLNPLHNMILLTAGVVALYFGTQGTEFQARNVCRVLGVMFALLGAVTLLMGPGSTTIPGIEVQSDSLWKLIPGRLEYSAADGWRDLLTGIVGLVAGFLPREKEIQVDMAAQNAKQKVGTGR